MRASLHALAGLWLCLTGCTTAPPRLVDRHLLAHVEAPETRLYYRDLERSRVERLVPEIAAVRSEVLGRLGFPPPRAELVVYPKLASSSAVRETRCDMVRDERGGWTIVFAYPLADETRGDASLLGTTGHELAEATVLLRVGAIDPYLRWVHDGLADLVEHWVLLARRPRAAAASLARARRFVEERLGAGDEFVDLRRWRQLAPWIVHSHRFLGPNQANLSLDDVPAARARVRRALASLPAGESGRTRGLRELEQILARIEAESDRGFVAGEARPTKASRDFLCYALAQAYWLEVEELSPGAALRFVRGLDQMRRAGDGVLSAHEAETLLQRVCPNPPPLSRYTLERALEAFRRAEARVLARSPR